MGPTEAVGVLDEYHPGMSAAPQTCHIPAPYLGFHRWGWGCPRRARAFNVPAVGLRHALLSLTDPDGVDGGYPHEVRRAGGQEAAVNLTGES